MRGEKQNPTRLEVGMMVTRTPETIYSTDDKGKSQHQAMRGRVEYVHPRGLFHTVAFQVRGGTIKESFRGVAV